MPFLSKLEIENADNTDDGQWLLTAPLVYQSPFMNVTYTVPVGFQTDLASVPRIPIVFSLFGATSNEAAALHDCLYVVKGTTRAQADHILREASAATGVPFWRRWPMWAGVRLFGFIAWREDNRKLV